MAELKITIPDGVKDRVLDAIALAYNYREEIEDVQNLGEFIPNPQTKAQFAREYLVKHVKGIVRSQEGHVAAISGREAAETKVDSEISIT